MHLLNIVNADDNGILFVEVTEHDKRLSFSFYLHCVNDVILNENTLIFVKWIPILRFGDMRLLHGDVCVFHIKDHRAKMRCDVTCKCLVIHNMTSNLRTVVLFKSSKLAPVCENAQFVEGNTSCFFDVSLFVEFEIMTFEMRYMYQLPHVQPIIGDCDYLNIMIESET